MSIIQIGRSASQGACGLHAEASGLRPYARGQPNPYPMNTLTDSSSRLTRPTPMAATMLGALLLILAWEFSGLDLAVVGTLGDEQGFSLRNHWLFSTVLHEGIRRLAWVGLALLIASTFCAERLGLQRSVQIRWLVMAILISLLVPGIKQLSLTSCPWSLSEFGSVARYVSHWEIGTADGGPGGCFPSGHVVNALAFLPGWALYRTDRPALARRILAAVVMLTVLAGIAQVLRGAHYPSHVFWSAWLCALLALIGSLRGEKRRESGFGGSARRTGSDAAHGLEEGANPVRFDVARDEHQSGAPVLAGPAVQVNRRVKHMPHALYDHRSPFHVDNALDAQHVLPAQGNQQLHRSRKRWPGEGLVEP
jgi:membrane-associated PAP2 superfamily phosphatase